MYVLSTIISCGVFGFSSTTHNTGPQTAHPPAVFIFSEVTTCSFSWNDNKAKRTETKISTRNNLRTCLYLCTPMMTPMFFVHQLRPARATFWSTAYHSCVIQNFCVYHSLIQCTLIYFLNTHSHVQIKMFLLSGGKKKCLMTTCPHVVPF